MARTRSQSPSVALFPFLAVLVCTMGALIFLLLVTTRQIRDRAVAAVRAAQEAETMAMVPPKMSLPTMSIPAISDSANLLEQAPATSSDEVSIGQQAEETSSISPIEMPEQMLPSSDEPNASEIAQREHAIALAERERELEELLNEWRSKVSALSSQRVINAKALAERKSLHVAGTSRIASLTKELEDEEAKLKALAGGLTASTKDSSTEQERLQIEKQIASLKKRIQVAHAAQADAAGRFQVVPFDMMTGTSRRPILIECTADGLRFVPENVIIRPSDLEGFTPRVNPLLAGSNALVKHWTQWNLKQPQPSKQPEPYVLLLVRPSGTVAYYVALRMLTALSQPHGYELIAEETELLEPELDQDAKVACESAVQRLLDERNQILAASRGKSGGAGFFGRGGSNGDAFRQSGGSSGKGGESNNRFEVADVTGDEGEVVGTNSWERIENFAGRGSKDGVGSKGNIDPKTSGDLASGNAPFARTRATSISKQGVKDEHSQSDEIGITSDGTTQNSLSMGRRNGVVSPGRGSSGTPAEGSQEADSSRPASRRNETGIEELAASDQSRAATSNAAPGSSSGPAGIQGGLDTGLGPSRPTPVPVFDQRTKKLSRVEPIEPEAYARKRWGLSGPDAVIGLERDVRVVVESSRLVVGGKHAIQMGAEETKQEAFERIVSVLEVQAHDWGQPPQGFFWKPHLEFIVEDGANANYERVKNLAERAGLATSTEFAGQSSGKPSGSKSAIKSKEAAAPSTLRSARGAMP